MRNGRLNAREIARVSRIHGELEKLVAAAGPVPLAEYEQRPPSAAADLESRLVEARNILAGLLVWQCGLQGAPVTANRRAAR